MFLKISAAAAALAAATALAGAASAQSQTDSVNPAGPAQTSSAPASQNGPGPSDAASTPATDTSGYNVGAPQTDPNTGAQIVTNGPVPDTSANRARFGAPDSHAGKRTAPAGN